jgi:hypothetical protein
MNPQPSLRWMVIVLVAILLFTFGRILSAFLSIGIATALGCELNEASIHPCALAGFEIGDLLAAMFVLGWLELVTFPLGALALLACGVVAMVMRMQRQPSNN